MGLNMRSTTEAKRGRTLRTSLQFLPRRPTNLADFRDNFSRQFDAELSLKPRISQIIIDYFADESKPGILLFEERLRDRIADQDSSDRELRNELQRAQRLVMSCLAL